MATPRYIKNLSRNGVSRGAVSWLASLAVRLAAGTGKWRIVGLEYPQQFWQSGKPFIACFWHGRLMMMSHTWRTDQEFHMLISSHADGQLISQTINRLGFKSLAGSTKRGGAEALRAMVRVIKDGGSVGITPDGPRGPRMRANTGAVALARLSGAPILPLAFGTSRRRVMSSWDRFVLALPFGRGVFVWGEPIQVPRDADQRQIEIARAQLEAALIQVTNEADSLTGQPTIEPEIEPNLESGAAP